MDDEPVSENRVFIAVNHINVVYVVSIEFVNGTEVISNVIADVIADVNADVIADVNADVISDVIFVKVDKVTNVGFFVISW